MKSPFLRTSAITLTLSLALLASCSKDDDKSKVEFPTQYSHLSVEENKQNLEDNGIDLVDNLTSIKNSTGIQTSIAFSKHIDGSTLPNNLGGRAETSRGLRALQLLALLGEGKSTVSETLRGMRTTDDDFTSLKEEYDKLIGVYTYSKANDTWTYEQTGDKIVFKFPSTEAGTENNAEYDIYGYKGVTIANGIVGSDYEGDYPTALKADLKVDGVKKMGYEFSASYNSDGDPTSLTIAYTIDNYTFTYALKNSTSSVSVDYSLTKDSSILLAFGLGAEGNFTADDVENSSGPEDVVTKGSAYFQIMNIKFSGKLDFNALSTALENADTEEQVAQAWNDNYKLIVFYADSKEKIADSEFYVVPATEFDDAYVDVRIIFADESKSDLSTYTDVGFQDLKDAVDDFVDSF